METSGQDSIGMQAYYDNDDDEDDENNHNKHKQGEGTHNKDKQNKNNHNKDKQTKENLIKEKHNYLDFSVAVLLSPVCRISKSSFKLLLRKTVARLELAQLE